MGIKGLSSFLQENPHLFESYKLYDTKVIIDGNNLAHDLYFNKTLDCIYGGDYDRYAIYVRKYFTSFLECNIKPIVIFDGGLDKSDRKMKKKLQKCKIRQKCMEQIAKSGTCSEKKLPILSTLVFRNVLSNLGIPFAQCNYEADDQLPALSNYYECPLLSNDGDFYMFDIHHGFIPLRTIKPYVESETDRNGFSRNYLHCKLYRIDRFLSYFPGFDKKVLPLFGILMGNDYVEPSVYEHFFANIKLPRFRSRMLIVRGKNQRVVNILLWLRNNTLHHAKRHMLNYVTEYKRENIGKMIDTMIDSYSFKKCHLTCIIEKRFKDVPNEIQPNNDLTSSCGEILPPFFQVNFNSANFPASFLNVITVHRVILKIQVEDASQESALACCRSIRRAIYGMLLRHQNADKTECTNTECIRCVDEYGFNTGTLRIEQVEPLFTIQHFGKLPLLNELGNLDKDKAKQITATVLGEDVSYLDSLPEEWQLLIGTINYWLRNSNPPPLKEFVYAVILNIFYFGLTKPLNSRLHCVVSKATTETNLSNCPEVKVLKARVTPAMAKAINKKIEKYDYTPHASNTGPIAVSRLHSFSQLQLCIMYAMYLNSLLGLPFNQTEIEKSFDGILLYNLATRLLLCDPDLFVLDLLEKDSAVYLLFDQLKNKMLSNLS